MPIRPPRDDFTSTLSSLQSACTTCTWPVGIGKGVRERGQGKEKERFGEHWKGERGEVKGVKRRTLCYILIQTHWLTCVRRFCMYTHTQPVVAIVTFWVWGRLFVGKKLVRAPLLPYNSND